MPYHIQSSTGMKVDAATATDAAGRIKPGYRQLVAEGESVGFDMAFMDSKAGGGRLFLNDAGQAPKSIDEAVQNAIAAKAKALDKKPSEWLAQNAGQPLDDLIATTVNDFAAATGSSGSATFNLDQAAIRAIRDAALMEVAFNAIDHNAWRDKSTGAGLGKAFADAANANDGTPQARALYEDAKRRLGDDLHNGWRRQSVPTR